MKPPTGEQLLVTAIVLTVALLLIDAPKLAATVPGALVVAYLLLADWRGW